MGDNEIIDVEKYHKYEFDFYDDVKQLGVNTDECYEDEDDENDENNWRNEYPEDESDSDSENECNGRWGKEYSKKSYSGDYDLNDSCSDEDNVYSGYRHGSSRLKFDPYAKETQEDYYYTVADDDPADET